MDLTKLISVVKNGKSSEFDELYNQTFEILCSYLRVNMRANIPDAEDCAQHALIKTVESIKNEAIREPESIYSYLLKSARNKYLRVQFENRRSNYQDDMEPYSPADDPFEPLQAEDEQKAMADCLQKLNEKSRAFLFYWFEYPDAQASDVAGAFDITVSNVWTKKHRIIKRLSDCIREKLKH